MPVTGVTGVYKHYIQRCFWRYSTL